LAFGDEQAEDRLSAGAAKCLEGRNLKPHYVCDLQLIETAGFWLHSEINALVKVVILTG